MCRSHTNLVAATIGGTSRPVQRCSHRPLLKLQLLTSVVRQSLRRPSQTKTQTRRSFGNNVNPEVVVTRHNGQRAVRDSSTALRMTMIDVRRYAADTGGAESGLRNDAITSGRMRNLSSSLVGGNFDSAFG